LQETLVRKLFVTFMLAALIIPACSAAPAQKTPIPVRSTSTPNPSRVTPSPAELEITDPEKVMEVAAGQEFTITVEADLPAEYHWEVAEELDSNIVAYLWKVHIPEDPGKSSARDVWRFQAVAAGETTITLGYYEGLTNKTAEKPVFTIVVK
jgi:predicted secreted protein